MATYPRKNGRPTKRTKAVLTPLFAAIRMGVPYRIACAAAGVTYECFTLWRKADPVFDAEVEAAAAESAVKIFNTIREQTSESWQAGAWALERRWPDVFGKPEVQLNISNQAAVINGGVSRDMQTIVVSDVEFVSLQQHPLYRHEPAVYELEQVPAEVSGSLKREGHNIVVISETKALAREQRSAELRAKTLAMFERKAANVSGETGQPEPVSQSAPSEGVLPELPPPSTPDAADEAERIAAALRQIPPNVRGFFESGDV